MVVVVVAHSFMGVFNLPSKQSKGIRARDMEMPVGEFLQINVLMASYLFVNYTFKLLGRFKTCLLLNYVRTPTSIYYPHFKNAIKMMNESQNSDQSQNAENAERKINPTKPKSVRVG